MECSDKYNRLFKGMPSAVVNHLNDLITDTGISDNPKMVNRFLESWLTKRAQFQRIIEKVNYSKENVFFRSNDKNSCIVMTISGSLVTIGPMINGVRAAAYTSIGLRTDVPMVTINEKSELEKDIELYKNVFFKVGPVKATSLVMVIAVIGSGEDITNQISELKSINDFLLKRFIGINIDFLSEKYNENDLIHRNDLFEKWKMLEWFKFEGVDEYISVARAKLVWLELFLKFHKHLVDKEISSGRRDKLFLELCNVKFFEFLEANELIYSEVKNNDINLLQALEAIPVLGSYVEFGKKFYSDFE